MEQLQSRVLKMDAWASGLAFQLSPSETARLIAAYDVAAEGAELKCILLRIGHNVGLCPWRPWNGAVAPGL